ncbi:hypothetical protein [Permianibacter aggregans]|uniref:Metalloprotease with PDZ domain n=2 Tax=Permianibacter aggregans TaxID=1510150 RepID=A0A4R6UTP8_9GAMM|nr:hypothetical protein [Permianibacter aggregans]TDQ49093.1 hypothetical protein EV696_10567 [Permianibacter aggregans]
MRLLLTLFSLLLSVRSLALQLVITEDPAKNSWLVEYVFQQPVKTLQFNPGITPFIDTAWRHQGKSLDGHQLIMEKPASRVAIDITHPYHQTLNRQFTPFIRFSGNRYAMFVDHYLPTKIFDAHNNEIRLTAPTSIRLQSVAERALRFGNTKGSGTLEITATEKRYAYFGVAETSLSKNLETVIDTELPNWIKAIGEKDAKDYEAYFRQHLIGPAPSPLFVALGFAHNDAKPFLDGGYIGGEVLLNISGNGWFENNRANQIVIGHTVAHELAHAWQAQREGPDDKIWLKEGAADLFAYQAMLDLQQMSASEYRAVLKNAHASCMTALSQSRLSSFRSAGFNKAPYHCGHLLLRAAIDSTPKNKAHDIWPILFAKPFAHDFEALNALDEYFAKQNATPGLLPLDQQLDEMNAGTRIAAYSHHIANLNLPTVNVPESKADRVATIIEFILASACPGAWHGYWDKDHYIEPDVDKSCTTLSRDFWISTVNGINIFQQPDEAAQELERSCQRSGYLTLRQHHGTETRKISCSKTQAL